MSHLPSRPTPSTPQAAAVALLVVAFALVACSPGGGTNPPASNAPTTGSGGPSTAPSEDPATGEQIEHPTGAKDVVLRYEEGGGFVMPAFIASSTPHFTLYGDGTVVFRNPMLEGPPMQGSVFLMNPLRTVRLTEEQVQEILLFALGDGGLAAARERYDNQMVADASTALFTINAGGITKQVSVYALGLESMPGEADGPARAAFKRLAERLTDFDNGGIAPTDPYVPPAYRVALFDATGMEAPDVHDWPWTDVAVTDFAPDADPNGFQFPYATLTPNQIDATGVTDYAGGFQGLLVTAPDGKLYTLAVRPLLPEEVE